MSGAHRQAHRGRTLTGLAVALCCGAAVLVSVATAEAAPGGWEREVDRVDHLITHLDGAVSVGSCSVSTDGSTPLNAIQTISRDGASVTNVSSTLPLQPQLCSFNSEVGSDGTVYTIASDTDAKPYIAAYRNGTQLWAIVPPDPCSESRPSVPALRLGPDGNVYILNGHQTDCGGTRYYLTKLNAADGSTIFSHSVGSRSVDDFDLMPYESGVAVLSGDKLHFFGLDGATKGVVDVPVRDGEFVARPAVNHQGRVFIDIVQDVRRTSGCEKNQITARIAAFETAGAVHEHRMQPCTALRDFRPTPTGGLVVAVVEANNTDRVVSLDGSLTQAGSYDPGTGTVGGRSYEQGSHRLLVDVNGRVVLTRRYTNGARQVGMQLTILSESLAQQAAYYTQELDSEVGINVGQVGLADGRIYIGGSRCASGSCTILDSNYVFSLPVTDVAIDYPRGVLLRASAAPVVMSRHRYVVLGDSIPYGHGLANPGENEGPSTEAYPQLVQEGLPALMPLRYRPSSCDLGGGRGKQYDQLAISGAPSIINPWSGKEDNCDLRIHRAVMPDEIAAAGLRQEPPALVTIHVGADDIRFDECLKVLLVGALGGEACTGVDRNGRGFAPTRVGAELYTLQQGLQATIRSIERAAPGAQIVIVNYYQIVPAANAELPTSESQICKEFRSMSSDFRKDVRKRADSIQRRLNETLQSVARRNPNVLYIDISRAFDKHEMCTRDSWVFDDLESAAHPTAFGHTVIARAILSKCATLPKRCITR